MCSRGSDNVGAVAGLQDNELRGVFTQQQRCVDTAENMVSDIQNWYVHYKCVQIQVENSRFLIVTTHSTSAYKPAVIHTHLQLRCTTKLKM